jgi:peptide/nickel transport system substrate-binding protein
MINNTLRGLGELQNSPISVQSPFYISAKDGLKVYNYNPQHSKELLKQAGFNYISMSAVRDRISGLKYSAIGGVVWNIHELKITDN